MGALLLSAEKLGWHKLRVATWASMVKRPGFWRPGDMELLSSPDHTRYFLVLSGPRSSEIEGRCVTLACPVAGDPGSRGSLRPDTALLGALCWSCIPLLAFGVQPLLASGVQPRLGGSHGTVCLLGPQVLLVGLFLSLTSSS